MLGFTSKEGVEVKLRKEVSMIRTPKTKMLGSLPLRPTWNLPWHEFLVELVLGSRDISLKYLYKE